MSNGTPRPLGEQWPTARNVRADLIRWLFVDREARKEVDPKGAWILGARITGRLDLSYANVVFPLFLLNCRLEQDLDLKWAKMPLLSLAGSWTEAIFAEGLKLEGSLFLTTGFHAEGVVRLLGATIGGNLDARCGTFKNLNGNALQADGIKVGGDIFLSDKFVADGTVRLVGAIIGGDLDATAGTFRKPSGNALSADRIEVTGDVFLSDNFVAAGQVRLSGAQIKGQLEVVDAWLDELNLDSAHITRAFIWQKIHRDHKEVSSGRCGKCSFFWRSIHKDHGDQKDRHLDFPDKEWKPSLDLTDAKVGSLVDEKASWPEKGRLILEGFVYDRIAAVPDAKPPTDAKASNRCESVEPMRKRQPMRKHRAMRKC